MCRANNHDNPSLSPPLIKTIKLLNRCIDLSRPKFYYQPFCWSCSDLEEQRIHWSTKQFRRNDLTCAAGLVGMAVLAKSIMIRFAESRKVVEALMNDKIQLTPREWSDLVESKLDNQSLDGQMIRILARVPGLMERARKAISMENADSSSQSKLRKECQALGGQLQPIMATARSHLDKNDLSLLSNHVDPPQNTYFVHALRSRSYGFALMVNAILQRISHCLGEDVPDYSDQSRHLAQDIITLAVIARRYRPLGSMYMITCLTAAYVVTDDLTIQNASAALIQQYRTDLSGPNTKSWTSSELDWLRQRFMLRESCTYDEAFHTYV